MADGDITTDRHHYRQPRTTDIHASTQLLGSDFIIIIIIIIILADQQKNRRQKKLGQT